MKFIETKLNCVIIVKPRVFKDNRGYFFESYNAQTFHKNGIKNVFVQDNQSYSQYGTIRGLHFQQGQNAQAKLVRVLRGAVLDVAVDIRPNSETFGQHVTVELTDENQEMLFIPRGFAHGFSVLSPDAIFSYKCDNFYNKESEGGILYNDPDINIDWRIPTTKAVLSDKDKLWSTLKQTKIREK